MLRDELYPCKPAKFPTPPPSLTQICNSSHVPHPHPTSLTPLDFNPSTLTQSPQKQHDQQSEPAAPDHPSLTPPLFPSLKALNETISLITTAYTDAALDENMNHTTATSVPPFREPLNTKQTPCRDANGPPPSVCTYRACGPETVQ